jgi:hypothetical protein
MRTPHVVALLLAAGCSRPPPAAGPAAAPAAAAAPQPAAVTCGDAGVLLRGKVDDQKQAGPAKEAAIASTCRREKWSAEMLRCVGERPVAHSCLETLTSEQRAAYDQALVAWNDSYPDEVLEEVSSTGEGAGTDDFVDCSEAITDVSSFSPVVTLAGDERDYLQELRKAALLEQCESWSYEQRGCFRDLAAGGAGSSAAIDGCRAKLDPGLAQEVSDKLAELDRLGAKIAALKKNAASHDCKKVVATYYADAAWKDKMGAVKGADRTRAIAETRARMAKACTDEKWSPNLRACIVAGAGEACFTPHTSQWGFPAFGVYVKSGIAECDTLVRMIKALDACTAIEVSHRDALKQSLLYMSSSWANLSAEHLTNMTTACKSADEMIARTLTQAGCPI